MHIGICVSECVCVFVSRYSAEYKNDSSKCKQYFPQKLFLLELITVHFFSRQNCVSIWTRPSIFHFQYHHQYQMVLFFSRVDPFGPSLCIFCFSFVVVKVRYISGLLLSLSFVVVFFCVMAVRQIIGETNGNGNKLWLL